MTKAEKPDEYHLRLLSWLGVAPRDQGSEAGGPGIAAAASAASVGAVHERTEAAESFYNAHSAKFVHHYGRVIQPREPCMRD